MKNRILPRSASVAKNIAALLLREGCSKGTYLFLSILIARRYGRELLGQYALALLIPRLFFTISEMGLNTLLTREVAKSKEALSRYMVHLGALRLLIGASTLLVMIGFARLFYPSGALFGLLCLSGASYAVINFVTLLNAAFRSFEKMEYEARVLIFRDLLFLLCAVLWVRSRQGLSLLFLFFLACNGVALGYAVRLYRRSFGWPRAALDIGFCRKVLRGARPIWLISLFSLLYLYVDSILLSLWKGEAVVGLYNVACMFVEPFILASAILTGAFFPIFARVSHNPTELRETYAAVFKFAFFCFLPLQLALLVFAPRWVTLFYGLPFLESAKALRLLMTGGVLFAVGSVNAHCLMACGDESFVSKRMAAFLLLNVLLNLWWIPRFSFIGSSLATVFCEALVFLVFFLRIRGHAGPVRFGPFFGKLAGSGTAMVAAWLASRRWAFSLSVLFGLAVYLLVDIAMRGYLWQERKALGSLWKESQGKYSASDS